MSLKLRKSLVDAYNENHAALAGVWSRYGQHAIVQAFTSMTQLDRHHFGGRDKMTAWNTKNSHTSTCALAVTSESIEACLEPLA